MTVRISCATCGREHTPESLAYAKARAKERAARRRSRNWAAVPVALSVLAVIATFIVEVTR